MVTKLVETGCMALAGLAQFNKDRSVVEMISAEHSITGLFPGHSGHRYWKKLRVACCERVYQAA